MIIIVCFILFSVLINNLYYRVNKNMLNPIFILSIIWNFVFIAHGLYFGTAIEVYFWIFIAILIYSITFIVIEIAIRNRCNYKRMAILDINIKNIYRLIKILTVVELVKVLYNAKKILSLAGTWNIFFSQPTYVRNLYLARNAGIITMVVDNLLSYITMLGIVLVPVYISYKREKSTRILSVWLVLEAVNSYILMSKMDFMVKLSIFLFCYLFNFNNTNILIQKVKKLIIPIVIAIFSFLLVIGMQRNYTSGGIKELIDAVSDKTIFYFVSPIEAFSNVLKDSDNNISYGTYMFLPILKLLSRINILPESVNFSIHAESITTMYGETNVYSLFGLAYMDFSYFGLIVFPIILGILSALIFGFSKKNISSNVFKSFLLMSIVMSFYTYMYAQTFYILFPMFALFGEVLFKKYIYIQEN